MLRLAFGVLAVAMLVACSGENGVDAGVDGGTIGDGGTGADAGRDDAGAVEDGGRAEDGGTAVDAGRSDGGTPVDAGPTDAAVDASNPCGDFGRPCSGAGTCGGGYTCDTERGRCLPSDRPICGGFAGARCPTDGAYTQCVYLQSADYGPCLTPAEELCACTMHRDLFSCS